MLGVLYLIFSYVLRNSIEHYPIYLLLGLITWNMFTRGTTIGMSSILSRADIIGKTSIPLEVPAISSVITTVIMLFFDMIAFAVFMIIFNFVPSITILWLPLIFLLETVLVLGIALPLSVLNVSYRDLQYIWMVVLQAGFFLSPIAYHFDLFPQEIRPWLYLNPVAGIIDLSHAVVLGTTFPSSYIFPYIIGLPFVSIIVGYLIFVRLSPRALDEL